MVPLAAASMMSRRLCGCVAQGRFAPLVSNGTGTALASRGRTSTRRSFNDWGSPIPEPEFTPGETILLDVTAWFVALALVYTPSSHSQDLEDEIEDKPGRRLRSGKKNDHDTPKASGEDH